MSIFTALSTMPGTEEIKTAWTQGSNYKTKNPQGNFTPPLLGMYKNALQIKRRKMGGYTFLL